LAIVVIGALCLLAGLAVRYGLGMLAARPDYSAPLPRKGLNAPFITSPDSVVDRMVELADLNAGDLVYDLGCGDGRIVIGAVLRSGCQGVGFDLDPQRVAEAKENAKLHGVEDRVEIVEQDIFNVDLSQADVAMMYLLPWMMNALLPQFDEMKPGARIVSHEFWIDGVQPDEIADLPSSEGPGWTTIYVYVTPLKKDPAMEKGKPPRPDDLASP
jgi:SAM-dependent methyltransferase